MDECQLRFVQQQLLGEEVAAGIACQRQFGQADDFHAAAFGLDDQTLYLLDVVLWVGYVYLGYRCSHFDETVIHSRVTLNDCFAVQR